MPDAVMSPVDLPKFPDIAPAIQLDGLALTLLHDFDRFSSGSMLLRIADCDLEAFDADGKVQGSLGMAVGGPFYVQHQERLWELSPESLYRAVLKAEAEQYLESAKLANPLLCQAWGETELPTAKIVHTPTELRAFLVDEVFADSTVEGDEICEADKAMSEIIGRDWHELGEWEIEFEIGRVQVHPVYAPR